MCRFFISLPLNIVNYSFALGKMCLEYTSKSLEGKLPRGITQKYKRKNYGSCTLHVV